MIGNLLIGSALLSGALKGVREGLKPPPPEPPEGIGIWWCPECNRWQAYQNDNPPPVCFYHKNAMVMQPHYYTYGGSLNGTS